MKNNKEINRIQDLIRCKDCKHSMINKSSKNKPLICGLTKMCGETSPDWFCADGELKGGE